MNTKFISSFLLAAIGFGYGAPAFCTEAFSKLDISNYLKDPKLAETRGEVSRKNWGLYLSNRFLKCRRLFLSDYIKLDKGNVILWIYEFDKFWVSQGGGGANLWLSTLAGANPRMNPDPFERTYVPFHLADSFADKFFLQHDSEIYKSLNAEDRSCFRNEAILDAINVICSYELSGFLKIPSSGNNIEVCRNYRARTLDRYLRKVSTDLRPRKL